MSRTLLLLLCLLIGRCHLQAQSRDSLDSAVPVQPRPTNWQDFVWAVTQSRGIKIMQDAGIGGPAIFQVWVSAEGQYLDHCYVRTPHPIAIRMLEPLIPMLQFEPGRAHGQPICMWCELSLRWFTY